MEDTIKLILQDLYKFDDSLMGNEEQLKQLIEELLKLKPKPDINEEFRINLRNQLLQKINYQKSSKKRSNNLIFWMRYIFGGAALAVIGIFISMHFLKPQPNTPVDKTDTTPKSDNISFRKSAEDKQIDNIAQEINKQENESLQSSGQANQPSSNSTTGEKNTDISNEGTIPNNETPSGEQQNKDNSIRNGTQIATANPTRNGFASSAKRQNDNAFGDLKEESEKVGTFNSLLKGSGDSSSSNSDEISSSAAASSAQSSESVSSDSQSNTQAGNTATFSTIINTVYKFKYIGKQLQETSKMDVYKIDSSSIKPNEISALLASFELSGFDANSFKNLSADSINLSENKAFGYSINIDFRGGSVSINQNYEKWPQTTSITSKSEMLSKNDILKIANDFVNKHSIKLPGYSKPYVQDGASEQLSQTNFPSYASVVYPQSINGYEITDLYGGNIGINLYIDIKNKKVSSFGPILKYSSEVSSYEAKPSKEILESAEKGGYLSDSGQSQNAKDSQTLNINTPVIKYVRAYKDTSQYLIPFYVFDVIKNSSNKTAPEQIYVPIIKNY